ncbi:MAG: hypothetical protein DRH08_01105 [Deltaproteobacteria bacterium]|nr:MAG: hypothetical protein DRH08_01105 [Deltaproteobacteria bacterium]
MPGFIGAVVNILFAWPSQFMACRLLLMSVKTDELFAYRGVFSAIKPDYRDQDIIFMNILLIKSGNIPRFTSVIFLQGDCLNDH